jgi:hypothetical protein
MNKRAAAVMWSLFYFYKETVSSGGRILLVSIKPDAIVELVEQQWPMRYYVW